MRVRTENGWHAPRYLLNLDRIITKVKWKIQNNFTAYLSARLILERHGKQIRKYIVVVENSTINTK